MPSIVTCTFPILDSPLRVLHDRLEWTFRHADTALDTFVLIDAVRLFLAAADRADRTVLGTNTAALADFIVHHITQHGDTDAGRTFFVSYMRLVFVSKIPHCRKHRIRRGLPEAAE